MNEVIVIQSVRNGYVVTLPALAMDPMAKSFQQAINAAQGDPMLQGKDMKKLSPDTLPVTDHVLVFETFEEVLAFLAKTYV